MKNIYSSQKVAEVLKQHPQTYRVFHKHGCPDMRKGFFSLMARCMSIRNAARVHRIPLDILISDLENSISNEKMETGN